MKREIMPDNAAEDFYQFLIPPSVLAGNEKPEEALNHHVGAFAKRAEDGFASKKGGAIGGGTQNLFEDEVSMIVPARKDVFVF